MEYVTLDSDGENDEGTGWDIDELAGECEADFGIDEDGPQQPELLLDASLLEAIGGVGQIKSNAVPKELLKTMAKTGWAPLTKQTPYEYLIQPALEAAATPSGAVFYFMQPTLWEDIAAGSTNNFVEKLDKRV
ncbi:hypothetical protein PC113_g7198 [Phytophthora cactorum]|nr:hypothetical protein PC111_g7881 [Phytophthora cactorum]KAG2838345.1 hypothetical protein PC112_g4544 [Phytophthora cactorum]KAG2861408.1 hypothetical protein PC113_g7198 [Phytophthora cactorum]